MEGLSKIKQMFLGKGKLLPQIITSPLPTWFHFALTNACNLSCPFCWRNRNISSKKRFEHAPDKAIDQWLDLINDGLDVVHPGGGGEPLLHPRFGEFIRKALDLQKSSPEENPEIRIVTNGTLIGKWTVLLDAFETGRIQIVVSIESADPERYELFRVGGSLGIVERNLCDIRKAREKSKNFKPRTRVIIDAILTRHNVEDAAGLIDFASRVGVDEVTFKQLQANSNSPNNFRHEDAVLTTSQLSHMRNVKKR